MQIPLVVGNWKMNKTNQEAYDFLSKLKENEDLLSSIDIVICPSFLALEKSRALLLDSKIHLGAQNIYKEEKGAFTGEISVLMIKPYCSYVILGHSERRKYFNETYADVKEKLRLALDYQIKPIICIGENLEERNKDLTEFVVRKQLEASLISLSKEVIKDIVIAYEPIWAIGTGIADQPEETNLVCNQIRKFLTEVYNKETADKVRILYGGSVTVENISSFTEMPGIDGFLIGGTSLNLIAFLEIIKLIKKNINQ